MAQNIALTLTLNGVEQTITSVQELEKAIQGARTALNTTFEGTQDELKAFNKQINDAQQSLDTLRNKKGNEENIKSIANLAKAGSAITSSFATASAAITLFGGDTEEISKASAKAQSILTIALGAREIAEGAVAVQTMVANAATALQTAATNTANAATKRFYATLAANPYTAILVAIGLVVGALVLLNDEESKSLELQKKLVGARQGAAKELKQQLILLTDSVKTTNLEADAIDDLKKSYPGFNAFIKDNNQLTAQGITFLRAKIGLMEQEAVIQAALAVKAEAEIKYQERLAEINDRKATFFKSQGRLEAENAVDRYKAQEELKEATKGANAAIATATQEAEKYSKAVRDGNKILENQLELEEKGKKAKDAQAEAQKKLTEEYGKLLDAQNEAVKGYNKINETDAKIEADIVERAKEYRGRAEKLRDERIEFFDRLNSELADETSKLLFEIIPSKAELDSIEDVYKGIFTAVEVGLQDGTQSLLDENGKAISFSLEEIKKRYIEYNTKLLEIATKEGNLAERVRLENLLDTKNIDADFEKLGKESEFYLIEYFTRLSETAELYKKGLKFGDAIISPTTTEDIRTSLIKATDAAKAILNNPQILKGLKDSEITTAIQDIFKFPVKSQKDFITALDATGEIGFGKYNEFVKIATQNLVDFAKVQAQQKIASEEVSVALEKETAALVALDTELGIVRDGIADGINILERLPQEQITTYIDFVKDKLSQEPEAVGNFLEAIYKKRTDLFQRLGYQGVMELFGGIAEAVGEIEGKSEEELTKLVSFLDKTAQDVENKFGKPAAEAFYKFSKEAQNALKSIENQKFLESFQKGIVEFTSTLADLGSTISDFYSTQLSLLETKNTRIQAQILGDSKKSNEKRLEQEKIYQEEKAKLEKKAAIRSLQISRATALANAAESITKIFAKNEPVSAAIFAAIATANNLVQVGIITSQINDLESYQRGGMIKGQGGLLVGPSHEQGGIRFGAMGLELEGGESVINRQSTMNYGALLSQINQSGGGAPLVNNNFDDSRILEALAKQKSEPIRAYVVESDISNKQAITRKLEQLSQI